MLDELIRELDIGQDEAVMVCNAVARVCPAHGPADRIRVMAALGAYQDARVAGLCREGAVELLIDMLSREQRCHGR